jgi:molybdate transport system substrate-binding protein
MKAAIFALGILVSCKHSDREVTVGAAISLKESMDDLAPRVEREAHAKVRFTFGASGDLASEMARGAPIDVLASAGDETTLAGVADETCTLAWNTLALVKRRGAASVDWSALASSPPSFRLAIGLVPQVPAGVYAEEALHRLGAWNAIAPKLVRGTNVRGVLDWVARGEADEGIVYATDVAVRADVELVALVPESARPIVRYPVYVAKRADDRTRALAKLLCDDASKRVLVARGFLDRGP